MPAFPRRTALLAVAALFVLGACRQQADDSVLDQDSALARDLARAGVDTSVQPQLQDVPTTKQETAPARRSAPRPAAPAPRRETPPVTRPQTPPVSEPPASPPTTVTKTEPGSERPLGMIASGTSLALTSAEKVCTNTNKVGDRFTATVNESVTGSNGAVIPAGSRLTIELTALEKSENVNDKIVMGFRVVSLTIEGKTYYPEADIVSAEITRIRTSTAKDDAKKVIGGAVVGAILGQVIGKDRKGTLIGAAVGAAAGGAAAAATGDYDGCVNASAPIVVRLTGPLTIAAE